MIGMKLLTALVRRRYSLVDLIGCTALVIWIVRGGSPVAGFAMIYTLLAVSGAMSMWLDRRDR